MTDLDKNQIFELLWRDAQNCLVFMDKEFNYLRVNQAFADVCRHPVDFFPGKNHFDLYPFDFDLFLECKTNGRVVKKQAWPFVFARRHGETTYWDWSLEPVKNDGQLQYFLFRLNDVTQHERVRRALVETEGRLNNFFLASYEVVIFHENGIIKDVSPSLQKFYGYWPKETIGKEILDLVVPRYRRQVAGILNNKSSQPTMIYLSHRDGREIPTDIYTKAASSEEGLEHQVVVLCDVTRRVEMEEAAKASRDELSMVLQDMLDVYYRLDLQGKILFTSKSVKELVGIEAESIVGLSADDFFQYPDNWEKFVKELEENDGRLRGIEFPIKHKDGSEIWVSINARFAHDKTGQIVGVEGITRDITDVRNAEMALKNSMRLYQDITENVPGAVYQTVVRPNQSVKLQYISESIFDLIGIRAMEVTENPGALFAAVVPEDLSKMQQNIIKSQGQNSDSIEFRMQHADGSVKWIQNRSKATVLKDGSVLKHGILLDITRAKQFENELARHQRELENLVRQRTSELIKSNTQYQIVTDNAGDVIIVHDALGKIIEINENGRKSLGYTLEEIQGLSVFEVDSTANPDFAIPFFQEFAPGEISSVEGRYRKKDGNEYIVDIKLTCYLDEANKKVFVAIARDMSRRVEYERKLEQSEAETQALLNAIPDTMLVMNRSGIFVNCHTQHPDDLALPKEDFIGKSIHQLFPKGFVARVMDAVERVFKQNNVEIMEYSLPINETVKEFEARFVVQNDDEVLILIRNITERKTVEYMLEESARYFQCLDSVSQNLSSPVDMKQAVESLLEYLLRQFDVDQVCLCSDNQASHDLNFVVKRPNITTKPFHSACINWKIPPGETLINTSSDKDSHTSLYLALPLLEGKCVLCMFDYMAIRNWQQNEVRLFKEIGLRLSAYLEQQLLLLQLKRELDLRKRTEKQLREAVEVAESANQAKSEFLSSMSHELRTPMNAILGFAQLLEIQTEDEELRDHIDEILNAGHHLLVLINEVLELSKIESGKIDVNMECVLINELINECMDLLSPMADNKGVKIDFDNHEKYYVWADRVKLKQVLINLMSNAVKYNRKGGTVRLQCHRQGEQLHINVQDSGIGIPESKQGELFTAFERLGMQTKGIEGTGIGLVITKNLVEVMGGEIGFESHYNEGSTFWVRLMCFIKEHEPGKKVKTLKSVRNRRSGLHESRFRVLYIEDNPANVKLIEAVFTEREDGILDTAYDPELGLQLAAKYQPNLILLDLNLPGMDGFEVLRRLKSKQELKDIPVIAVSALAMESDRQRVESSNFQGYITKPIDIAEFNKILDQFMGSLVS